MIIDSYDITSEPIVIGEFLSPVLHETRITAEQDRESIVCDICQTIISNGK